MAQNQLWKKLVDPKNLAKGWHLARAEIRQDFLNDPYYADKFTTHFEANLQEIAHRLISGTYAPQPITEIDVPKSSLAIRPGSVPQIEDRIVMQTVVLLLAPIADKSLPASVYSYRVKKKPTKTALFKESDSYDFPYLKRKTILTEIDPFESWYEMWPEFQEVSRSAFEEDGYNFLAISDISAYFENIQLPILRDLLRGEFPDEPILVNQIFSFVEAWSIRTHEGRAHWRGIPQGTQISSFLGNMFLLPLDLRFREFTSHHEARYFRYMDDVKVFTRSWSEARLAIMELDKTLRSHHLNIQSANSPLKKASLTGFHATAKHIAAKAVSPSSETMRTI